MLFFIKIISIESYLKLFSHLFLLSPTFFIFQITGTDRGGWFKFAWVWTVIQQNICVEFYLKLVNSYCSIES